MSLQTRLDTGPVIARIEENEEGALADLFEFLRIPSISADSAYTDDVRRCAAWVRSAAESAGLENARIIETDGHPIVYADWTHAHSAPTLLIYGHYDVQPAEPLDLWTSPAFEPEVRDGEIYARGAVDDKGQVHLHMKAIENWLTTHGALPVNVKLLIEGEEEVGSPNLAPFVRENRDLLACDAVMISDTPMHDRGMPSITYGLRGMAYFELHVRGADRDLHSGMFGGIVANPINVLSDLIAGMKDDNNRITLPGFYDSVVPVSDEERSRLADLPYDIEQIRSMIDIPGTVGEVGYTDLERLWARPTLDVCGIWGGYQGEGAKTVLPSRAGAKISMRLVANQTPGEVEAALRAYLSDASPEGVTVELVPLHGGPPALVDPDSAAVRAGLAALGEAFGTEARLIRNGGSIPIVADFAEHLEAPVVLMGFGLPDQNAHAPDEKMDLSNYRLGTKAAALYLDRFLDEFEKQEGSEQ